MGVIIARAGPQKLGTLWHAVCPVCVCYVGMDDASIGKAEESWYIALH